MNATYLLHHRMLKSALQETSPDEKHAITVCDFSSDEVVLEGVNANALSKIQYKRIDSAQAEGKKKIPLEKWIWVGFGPAQVLPDGQKVHCLFTR